MNLHALFEYRSGRVIAVFRAVLALVFFLALAIEPVSVGENLDRSYLLIGGYLLLSGILIVVAWRSWWYDHLLAPAMLATDALIFLAAVFLTEASDADFTSPFLAFFALTVLSATLRWDWRIAARTGVAITILFVVIGAAMMAADVPFDMQRFARRAFYMSALLMVLVWFGVQRRDPHVPTLDAPPDSGSSDALLWRALEFAMKQAGASIGALAWSPADEPWIEIRAISPGGRVARRVGPEEVASWDTSSHRAGLFDLAHQRVLIRDARHGYHAKRLARPIPLAAEVGMNEGLALPFSGVNGDGLMILGGIDGIGPDYITLGDAIAREAGNACDRSAIAALERETLITRTRSAIARDLHDSVAQSLAGACFRLEALRRDMHDGMIADRTAATTEIGTIRDALRREQAHVRSLIETLRGPAHPPQRRNLGDDLAETLADAGAHWGISAALDASDRAEVPAWISHEVQQLVREAVANGARHGHARHVSVKLTAGEGLIGLAIHDDGTGLDDGPEATRPWSISERVAALGGELSVASGPGGTSLAISLPSPAVTGPSA